MTTTMHMNNLEIPPSDGPPPERPPPGMYDPDDDDWEPEDDPDDDDDDEEEMLHVAARPPHSGIGPNRDQSHFAPTAGCTPPQSEPPQP